MSASAWPSARAAKAALAQPEVCSASFLTRAFTKNMHPAQGCSVWWECGYGTQASPFPCERRKAQRAQWWGSGAIDSGPDKWVKARALFPFVYCSCYVTGKSILQLLKASRLWQCICEPRACGKGPGILVAISSMCWDSFRKSVLHSGNADIRKPVPPAASSDLPNENPSGCFLRKMYLLCYAVLKFPQSWLTLCLPMNCSPPGCSVHGILRQEYWSELPYPPPGDLPDPGVEPGLFCLLHWQAVSLPLAALCLLVRYKKQLTCLTILYWANLGIYLKYFKKIYFEVILYFWKGCTKV